MRWHWFGTCEVQFEFCNFTGNGGMFLSKMAWTTWTSTEAIGTGSFDLNDCDPSCAAGTVHHYDVHVTLSKPLEVSCGSFFTDAVLSYPGQAPPRLDLYTHFQTYLNDATSACRPLGVPAKPELTLAGYGAISFGMTPAEAGARLGTPPTIGPNGNGTCADVSFAALPSGLNVYVIGGQIVAAEITPASSVPAEGGTHVGSTVDEVRQALGSDVRDELSPHTGTDLVYRTAVPATAGYEIRYVVQDGKVVDILAGVRSLVEQQDLCS